MRHALAYLARRLANQIAATPPAPAPTLASLMMGAIFTHARIRDEAAPTPGGPSVQAIEVLAACAEVIGSMATQGSDEEAERIIATAHAAIDAAYATQLTGVSCAVSYGGGVHAVH